MRRGEKSIGKTDTGPLRASMSESSPTKSIFRSENISQSFTSSIEVVESNFRRGKEEEEEEEERGGFYVAYCDPAAERAKAARRVEERKKRELQRAQSAENQRLEARVRLDISCQTHVL